MTPPHREIKWLAWDNTNELRGMLRACFNVIAMSTKGSHERPNALASIEYIQQELGINYNSHEKKYEKLIKTTITSFCEDPEYTRTPILDWLKSDELGVSY